MSLIDLGKNDISEETQALKDRVASRDTENAGLRTQLMRREAELEELQLTLNETVYKLSKEAERALHLEEEALTRSSELKTERFSLRNTELALQSTQEKLKAEERAKRELESTLDTISLHSQTTSAEHQTVQREKRALESRMRELERMVQTYEANGVSNISRKNGRPRSSSVSNLRLPAVEQELNDTKAQLHTKDLNLRVIEQKLSQTQDDLVKAENARISVDKASQKRISELLSTLERKEEELEALKETDNTGEREEELLKRIDEDAAKILALEKLVAESQTTRTNQARIQKLQGQLKAECEKVQRSEDLQNRLLHEKEELVIQYEASQRKIGEGHQLLMACQHQIKELEAKHAHLLAQLDSHGRCDESSSFSAEHSPFQSQRQNGIPASTDESALADHIETLLQAIDRLRSERDGLKRALEFSEVEYRITTEGFQTRIASLTRQLTSSGQEIAEDKHPSNIIVKRELRYDELEEEHTSTMTVGLQAQEGQAEDITGLRIELENVRTQLQNSLQNFADMEKLHDDVVKEFTVAKEIFERAETDAQSMEAKHKHDTDMLASVLEDREHEVDELHQQLQDISESHTRAERKLREELNSYEARHALMNDVEKDLHQTIADIQHQLAQGEAGTLALQEEQQLLQSQITGLQAEIQRSASLSRHLESRVKEYEDACVLLKEGLQRSELALAESEKFGKAAEFNLVLQSTQHENLVTALRREIVSLQSGPELRSALAEVEEKNRDMDDLLRAKCQEIEEYDDRILETLKANKKLTNKVESLTRRVQALQAKLALVKNRPQERIAEVTPPSVASCVLIPPVPAPAAVPAESYPSSAPSLRLRSKTPEPRLPGVDAPPLSHTPDRTNAALGCESSAGKKRPAPDDDERDSVPAEGHYSTDACLRNGPTPRLRRTHGHPAGFTPVRGATLRKPAGAPSPGRRGNAGVAPSEIITDVTNSPRPRLGEGDARLKKRSWLGKDRSGACSRPASSRLGTFGG